MFDSIRGWEKVGKYYVDLIEQFLMKREGFSEQTIQPSNGRIDIHKREFSHARIKFGYDATENKVNVQLEISNKIWYGELGSKYNEGKRQMENTITSYDTKGTELRVCSASIRLME